MIDRCSFRRSFQQQQLMQLFKLCAALVIFLSGSSFRIIMMMNTTEYYPILPEVPIAQEESEESVAVAAFWSFLLSLILFLFIGGVYQLYRKNQRELTRNSAGCSFCQRLEAH
jgi:cbb3-type cytochrome oxidase subunit 3